MEGEGVVWCGGLEDEPCQAAWPDSIDEPKRHIGQRLCSSDLQVLQLQENISQFNFCSLYLWLPGAYQVYCDGCGVVQFDVV